MLKLEDIESRAHVVGMEPSCAGRVIDVETAGTDAVNVSYKLPSGQIQQRTLFRSDKERHAVLSTTSQFTWRSSPIDFTLAAEASQLKLGTSSIR